MLDNLPRSTARAVEELADYQWASDEARALYQQILDRLRQEIVDQRFRGLQPGAVRPGRRSRRSPRCCTTSTPCWTGTPAARTPPTSSPSSCSSTASYFPEKPSNVDELIDALARRAAAGERLMRSLSPAAARGAGRG